MLAGIYSAFQHWGNQTVWIYSDPHFGDKDLEWGIENRPSTEEQIKMINSCVGSKDTIIFLGDIGDIEAVKQIRGYKVLIMGNHDAGKSNYEKDIFTEWFDKELYPTREKALYAAKKLHPGCRYSIEETHQFRRPFESWVVKCNNCLFDEVYEGALIVGEKLILSHEPVDIPWLFNIHGHDHAGHNRSNHLNVCSDVIGYTPINLNQFLKSGAMSKIQTIHRETIDNATKRKKKRGKKLGKR